VITWPRGGLGEGCGDGSRGRSYHQRLGWSSGRGFRASKRRWIERMAAGENLQGVEMGIENSRCWWEVAVEMGFSGRAPNFAQARQWCWVMGRGGSGVGHRGGGGGDED
jgi:hypothetical protein